MRLDLAFNLLVALGFTALLALLFELGRLLSGSVVGGAFAALLMPFNSSLAFRDYLRRWGSDPFDLPADLWQQPHRLHAGPYDGKLISIYYTLNPYLNQRQLMLAMALGVLVIVLLVRPLRTCEPLAARQAAGLGALLGLGFPLNGVVYLGVLSVATMLFLLFGRVRDGARFLLAAVVVALPSAVVLGDGAQPTWITDYLPVPATAANYLRYWWLNLGLLLPLLALAAIWGSGVDSRLLIAFGAPWVAGNLVQLGNDPGGINHKFFNLAIALMGVYGGVMLSRLVAVRPRRLRWLGPVAAALLLLPLTLSGVIDLMVIKNEPMEFAETETPEAAWLAANTAGDAVFLTAAYLYLPPSVAGRLLYLGYPPFTATAGYDTVTREETARQIYGGSETNEICRQLLDAGIDYVEVGPVETHPDTPLGVNLEFWDQLLPVYDASTRWGQLRYYRVAEICWPLR